MGDMADMVLERGYYDPEDDEQPSEGRCVFCSTRIWWEFDVEAQRWKPMDNRSNKRHFCKAMLPAPEQDFEVLT